jgi:hypothetical protein
MIVLAERSGHFRSVVDPNNDWTETVGIVIELEEDPEVLESFLRCLLSVLL